MVNTTLEEITLSIYDGKHGDCKDKIGSGCYFISVKDITDYGIDYSCAREITEEDFEQNYRRTNYDVGDTVYANTGDTIGKSFYVTPHPLVKKTSFQKSVAVIKPNPNKVNPRYLYYLLKKETSRLRQAATGSGQKNLLLSTMREFQVEIHDFETQKKIASVLSLIDEKAKINKEINDNLEQQLQLLYDYWFTQFDFPDESGKPYRSTGGKMEWSDFLKKEIPEGWTVQSVASNRLTSIIKPGVNIFDRKTYLATADVKGTSISTGTLVDYNNRESRANMQPSINSVWFAKMKNSIKHLYLNKEMLPIISTSILSTGFCGLQCSETNFEYVASYISNSYFEIHKDMLAHGATQEAVNNDDLEGVRIIVPDDKVLRAYHEIAQPIYAQIAKNTCENQELTKLRDWLLPMLMNGQATIID